MNSFVLLLGGFAILIVGGELLVRGAVQTAERLGVSPLLIGLTLVGFGTSAPEMVISVQAAMKGSPGIAIGNFVGSSITNILLILGLTALVSPILVSSKALARDGSVVLVTAVLFTAISFLLPFNEVVGWSFLALLVMYLSYAWQQERTSSADGTTSASMRAEAYQELRPSVRRSLLARSVAKGAVIFWPLVITLIGLAGIMLGGKFLVEGAVAIAREYGVSETIIGLTIVAIGTSMPELITSVVAAARRQPSIAIGNIMGSNIYNILGVGGITAALSPTVVPDRIVTFDNLVMVGAAIALVIFARSGFRINRWEGAALATGYGIYLYSLWPY